MRKLFLSFWFLVLSSVLIAEPIPIPHPEGSDTQIQYNNGGVFGGSHFYFDDATDKGYFQPTVDSTTAFQILDADGGTPIFNVDSTNERVGIKTNAPSSTLDVAGICTVDSLNILTTALAGRENLMTVKVSDSSYDVFGIANGTTADNKFYPTFYGFVKTVSNTYSMQFKGMVYSTEDASDSSGYGIITFRALRTSLYTTPNTGSGTNPVNRKLFTFANQDQLSLLVIAASGYLGINEPAPETLLELTHATPYLTLHNNTHEDTDGGRESRLNFKGEQSGGEETTLARIEVSHDGTSDDQKGKIVFSTNDGADADTPTTALTIDSTQTVTGKLRSSDGVSGTLVMDDGVTERITLVFTGGILTSRTVEATTSSALMDWTD